MACSALFEVDLYGPPTLHYVCYAKYDRVSMSYEDYTQKARAPPKKLLHFTDNGAKIALVKRNSNRNLVLEGCRPCPLFGGKLDNAAIGNAQN